MSYLFILLFLALSDSAHVDVMQPIEEWQAYVIIQDGIVTHHPIPLFNDIDIQFEKLNEKMYIKFTTKNFINVDRVVFNYTNYTKIYEINIIEDNYIKIKLDEDLNIRNLTEIIFIKFESNAGSILSDIVKYIYQLNYSAVKRY